MKRIFLTIALFLLATSAYGQGWQEARMGITVVGGGGVAGGGGGSSCASCNSGTDSAQYDSGITTTANDNGVYWLAYKFTVSGTKCVTGTYMYSKLNYGESANMYITSTNPGPIANAVAGTTKTMTGTVAEGIIEHIFDATVSLSAGTYWVIWANNTASAGWYGYASGGGGVNFQSSQNGTSWAQEDSYPYKIGVLGCDPS